MQDTNQNIHYLYKFKTLGLKYSGINFGFKVFNISSDTAFKNNINIKKSSDSFLMQFYNNLINWKASKQRIIIILNTKIELLALSSTAKKVI